MKSNSNDRPPILQDLGNGSWHYNYNITEVEIQSEPMAETEGEQEPHGRRTITIRWKYGAGRITTNA